MTISTFSRQEEMQKYLHKKRKRKKVRFMKSFLPPKLLAKVSVFACKKANPRGQSTR
jgi:hypothetical protein